MASRMMHAVWMLVLALPLVSQAASEPRYTYGEIGYINADYDDYDQDGDGFGLGGSMAINRNVHLLVGYQDIDLDGNDSVSAFDFGGGLNYALRPGMDALVRLRYIIADRDGFPGDDDEHGFSIETGLRAMINPAFELNGAIRYTDVFDDNTSLVLGALYDVVPNFALGGDLEFSDDYTAVFLKARYYFRWR